MSMRPVLIAVVVALALCGAALLTLRTAGPGAAEPTSLALAPDEVRLIEVHRPGGLSEIVQRESRVNWVVRMFDGRDEVSAWPADSGPVRNALRAAASLTAEPGAGAPELDDDASTLVRFVPEGGAPRTVRIGERRLGGQAPVSIDEGPVAMVAHGAVRPLIEPGPAGWRVRRALPSIGSDTDAVRLTVGDDAVALERSAGRWRLTEPVAARADDKAVRSLLGYLGEIRIERFLDGAPVAADHSATGLDDPWIVAVCETGEGEAAEPDTLRVGAAADAQGRTRFAGAGPAGRNPVVIDAGMLPRLSATPEALASRVAAHVPAADVAAIEIERTGGRTLRTERTIDGWSGDAAVDAAAVVRLLTADDSGTISFEVPEGWSPAATVRLLGLDGGPLAEAGVGADERGRLVLEATLAGSDDRMLVTKPDASPTIFGLPAGQQR